MGVQFVDTPLRKSGGKIAELSFLLEDFLIKRELYVSSQTLDEIAKRIIDEAKEVLVRRNSS